MEYKVGNFVKFNQDYGGHKKGTISKIVSVEKPLVCVEHKFGDTSVGCNLYMKTECTLIDYEESTINEEQSTIINEFEIY